MNRQSTPRFESSAAAMRAVRMMAIVAALVFAFSAQIASADCSDKARALGKCPHPKTLTAKSNAPEMGAVPLTHHNSPQTTPKRVKGPVIGPSPIQHSGNNALNPQPIPPGHPIHPLPPPGDQHDGSGH